MSIKAIIFDMGGVIIYDARMKKAALEVFNSVDLDRFWQLFNIQAMAACRGEEKLSDTWRAIAKELGVDVPFKKLETLWIDDFEELISVDYDLLQLIAQLKGHFKLGMLSNTIAEHAKILRQMGLYDPFDQVVLSHEARMTKDNPDLFTLMLDRLEVLPKEAVFIDDVEKFVAVSKELGIHGITYFNCEQLKSELKALNALPGLSGC